MDEEADALVHPGWSQLLEASRETIRGENDDDDDDDDDDDIVIDHGLSEDSVPELQADPLFNLSSDGFSHGSHKRLGRPKRALQELFAETPSVEYASESGSASVGHVHPQEESGGLQRGLGQAKIANAVAELIPQQCYNPDHFLIPSLGHFATQSLLSLALLEAYRQASTQDCPLDSGIQRLCDRFLNQHEFHLASGKIMQQLLSLDPKGLFKRLERLAAAICLMQRSDRATLEKLVVTNVPQHMCVLYLDVESYDETPMITSVKQKPISKSVSVPGSAIEANQDAGVEVSPKINEFRVATKAKLLQSRSCFAMLLQIVDKPCLIMGETLSPIAPLLRNQAQTLQQSLLRAGAVSECSGRFALKCRSVVVDQASSNLSCENSMLIGRGPMWNSMVLPCAVHQISSCITKTCEGLVSEQVSSLIKAGLSIVEGGKMTYFRQALTEEILSRDIIIIQGDLPMEAAEHQAMLKKLLIQKGNKMLSKHLMLQTTANGDWRAAGCLQHYVCRGVRQPEPAAPKATLCYNLGICPCQHTAYFVSSAQMDRVR